MSLHIVSGIEVKSGGVMSVYCLHEWNFKHDAFSELHHVVRSCLELLLKQLFHQKRETVEQPNETSRQLHGKALPAKQL